MNKDPKVVRFPKGRISGTVEIQPHPEDVIEVDPEILAIMKARLAGNALDDVFSRDDQMTSDLAIEREKKKLREIFANVDDVYRSFSSLKAIKETKTRLREQKIDRKLLATYAHKKSAGQPIDEADFYAHLIGNGDLKAKDARLEKLKDLTTTLGKIAQDLVGEVAGYYQQEEFSAFSVSREQIELSPKLKEQLKDGVLQTAVDEVLAAFYGRVE